MEFYEKIEFWIPFVISLVILFVALKNYYFGKTRFFRDNYCKHVRDILNLVNTKTNRTQNLPNFPHTIKNVKIINKQIIQHLFTYQAERAIKMYDIYREIITNPSTTGNTRNQLESDFFNAFVMLYEKANLQTNDIFGVCDDCLKNLDWKDKRKYGKILKEKKEADPNAWDDSKW